MSRIYTRMPADERFLNHVSMEPMSGCWIWTGVIRKNGYGSAHSGNEKDGTDKVELAHRLSYQLFKGEIPRGLEIDHLCRFRCCVNPDHLEAVTSMVNNHRGMSPWGINSRKTHCPRGHKYDRTCGTHRYCKTCNTESARRRRSSQGEDEQ